jgi:hypothetical protein
MELFKPSVIKTSRKNVYDLCFQRMPLKKLILILFLFLILYKAANTASTHLPLVDIISF